MSDSKQELIDTLNAHAPAIIRSFNGKIIDIDTDAGLCIMEWEVSEQFCHSGNVVQGGIITAMVDATMSHAVFAQQRDVTGLASLEIKVNFLEPCFAGRFICHGRIRRAGYKILFLEGDLYNAEGNLTATSSQTAKISRG